MEAKTPGPSKNVSRSGKIFCSNKWHFGKSLNMSRDITALEKEKKYLLRGPRILFRSNVEQIFLE